MGLAVPGEVDNRKEITHEFILADITVRIIDSDQLRSAVSNAVYPRGASLTDNGKAGRMRERDLQKVRSRLCGWRMVASPQSSADFFRLALVILQSMVHSECRVSGSQIIEFKATYRA
jgi:hypothetical protein